MYIENLVKKEFENIDILELDEVIINKLHKNNIYKIEEIWLLKRKDLKKMNLTDKEINYISIKLQLKGIDLNKKIYNVFKRHN